VLYEVATGNVPFRGEISAGLIDSILHKAPTSPVPLNPDLPEALEKDREVRYQHASDLRTDLKRLKRDTDAGLEAGMAGAHRAAPLRRWWLAALAGIMLAILAVLVGMNVGGLRDRLLGRASAPRIESIAVLPLASLSGDPEQEYFTDGMTEALNADLSKIGAPQVISRTSVMQYKGVKKPLQ
jgi:hypothetical protein